MGDVDRRFSIATYLGDPVWHLIPATDAISATVCEDGVLDGSKPGVEIVRPIPDLAEYEIGQVLLLQVATGADLCDTCYALSLAQIDLSTDDVVGEMMNFHHGC